jgi:nucleoid-associated protein YgaU
LAALFLTACQQKTAEPEMTSAPPSDYAPLDQMDSGSSYDGAARTDSSMTSYNDPADPVESTRSTGADETLTPGSGRTYTVKRGDTLFSIARREYNDQSKWRDIWNANRSQIPNKDKLSVGMTLRLP